MKAQDDGICSPRRIPDSVPEEIRVPRAFGRPTASVYESTGTGERWATSRGWTGARLGGRPRFAGSLLTFHHTLELQIASLQHRRPPAAIVIT